MLTSRPLIFLISLTAITFGAYLVLALVFPLSILNDAAHGFEVWQSMQAGASFNHRLDPDFANLALEREVFVSWWTPGQYLVPGLLSLIFGGITLGAASLLVSFMAMIASIIGWYRLYREFGFSELISSLSCAALVLSTASGVILSTYTGGACLLLGFAPWAFLVALKIGMGTLLRCVMLVVVFLIGFYLKSTFLIVTLAICGGMVFVEVERASSPRHTGTVILRAGLIFGITYLITKLTYMAPGHSPSDSIGMTGNIFRAVSFPLAGPLIGITSIDLPLKHIFSPAMLGPVKWTIDPLIMFPLAVLSVVMFLSAMRGAPDRRYRAYVLATFGAYAAVFAYFYMINSSVGFMGIYYRIPGLMLLPGALVMLGTCSKPFQWMCWILILGLSLQGPYISYRNFVMRQQMVVGDEHFSLPGSIDFHNALQSIDEAWPERTALIHLGNPKWSLQIRRQRGFVGHAWKRNPTQIQHAIKYGRPPAIYVALPREMIMDGRAEAILSTYVEVSRWKEVIFEDEVIYYPFDQQSRLSQ
jgi:hypothetical protein